MLINRNNPNCFSLLPVLAAIAFLVFVAESNQVHAFPLEVTLEASQLPSGNGQTAYWQGPYINISSNVGTQVYSIDIYITFADNKFLRMTDYDSFEVDMIGISLGGFHKEKFIEAAVSEFWASYRVEFTDMNGNPITMPPLTNNPVSASYRLYVPDSGYVFGSGTTNVANFVSKEQYANIYGLHYKIDFFSDSNLTTPQLVYFTPGTVQFQPRLAAADPILIGQNSPSPLFDMTEYWPLKPGTVWIFDRETLIVGPKTHEFTSYQGTQLIQSTTFCDKACGEHAYLYSGNDGVLFVGYYLDNYIDFSNTPIKFAKKQMMFNDPVVSTIPAGIIDDDAIKCTATLLAKEPVTVPGGTFPDTLVLQIRIDDSPTSHYIEKIWLAKGIGPVKIRRVSESPVNHGGCMFTCGSFDNGAGEGTVAYREINLENVIGPPIIDVKNDGKIGLEEAIFILQKVAGMR